MPWPALVVGTERDPVVRERLRTMMRTLHEWSLVEPGDKVMVALSGGKDSYALFDLMVRAAEKAPFAVEVIGVHLDQAQPGYAPEAFYKWLEDFGAPYQILREDTYSVVKDKTRRGQTYCVVCSRLRRGILYTAADRLGCNKIALGHHRDDALETFLMNTFFAGKLQAMPAKYVTDDGRFTVIRPLIDTAEDDLRAFAAYRGYPILPCNLCGSQSGMQRQEMKALLEDMTQKHPHVRQVMLQALKNVRPTHLLDEQVAAAWSATGGDGAHQLKAGDRASKTRHPATVVRSRGLPIVGQTEPA